MPARSLKVGLVILLLGFGLRLVLHDYHGLEGDDGFSLSLARLEAGELLRGLAALELDIHPPLHFIALKGWMTLAGGSLLSLRVMNIFAGLLTGVLMMRIAGRLFGRRAATIAGLLWIAAPLLIYSDYLIRMYTLLALFGTAGTACVIESRYSANKPVWYAAAGLFGLLAGYTHIVGGLIAATMALAVVAAWAVTSPRRTGTLIVGVGAFALSGLLYTPFARAVWNVYQSGRPLGAEISEASFENPASALAAVIQTALTHRLLATTTVHLVIALLLVIGSIWLVRHCGRFAHPILILSWSGIAGMSLLAWTTGFFKARYLTPFAPLVLILIAGMLAHVNRRWRTAVFAAVFAISSGGVLKDLERSYRDDWVAAVAFIEQHERPGDRVIVIPDWGLSAFDYHYRGAASVVGLFPQVAANIDYAGILEEHTADAARVWFVHYQPEISDPQRLAVGWFQERAVTITEVFPAGMHIRYYGFAPHTDDLPADAHPLDVEFGDALRLHGIYLPVMQGSARDSRLHPPSNWVQVILYWEALQPDLSVAPRVRLTDPYAQVYGAALERQHDLLQRYPVSAWQPGAIWETAYDLNMNPETPLGIYNIEVMVLDTAGQPLPAKGEDAGEFWVIAGQFRVE